MPGAGRGWSPANVCRPDGVGLANLAAGLRPALWPLAVAGVLSLAYLIAAPLTADHGAQLFRVGLFEVDGPVIWNNYWFGGHHLPGYSVLSPAIGSWIGFRAMGVVSVLGSVLLFSLIVDRQWGERARAGAIWFGATACISLYSGRLTFALGVLIAMLAVFLAQRGFRVASVVAAALVALASPVAALFLACAGASHWFAAGLGGDFRDLRGLRLAVAAFLSAVVVALLFPAEGIGPYVWSSFVPAIVLTLAALVLLPAGERLIRTGLAVYAVALLATFLIDTPMGGNVNRMGVLLIGPLVLCAGWPVLRRPALLVLIPFLLAWQIVPVVRDLTTVAGEEAVAASFYEPVRRELAPRLRSNPGRVEALPIKSHWESARLAPGLTLARGWERQADRSLNEVLYDEAMTAVQYRRWLDELSVHFVAVPATELDFSTEREVDLIESGPGYLEVISRTPDWTIYRVTDPRPMVEPPARLTGLGTDSFTVRSPRKGSFRVAIRWSRWWGIESGSGCLSETPDGFTKVEFDRPGRIEARAALRPLSILGGSARCSDR